MVADCIMRTQSVMHVGRQNLAFSVLVCVTGSVVSSLLRTTCCLTRSAFSHNGIAEYGHGCAQALILGGIFTVLAKLSARVW